MKKFLGFILCLLLLLNFVACTTAASSTGQDPNALEIDYVTSDGREAEASETEESESWLDWLRGKLSYDKEQRAEASQVQEEQQQEDAQSAAPGTVAAIYGQESVSQAEEDGEISQASSTGQERDSTFQSEEDQSSEPETSSSQPAEPSSEPENLPEEESTVTMHIRCDTCVANGMHKDSKWAGIVPGSGIILKTTTFDIGEGDTVFDVLCQARDKFKIHMQYTGTASSCYIQGINNLYEFDGGRWSGWMYNVNGWYPNYGAGVYVVKPGDKIEWNYTCDLGRDLPGGGWMADDEWMAANE